MLSSHRVVSYSQFHTLTVACIKSSSSSDTHRHHLTTLNSKGLHKHAGIKTGGSEAAVDAVDLYGGGVGEGESSAYMERSWQNRKRHGERQEVNENDGTTVKG
ncbi:hypothetical protein JB92DRAFT_2905667 [Gautieria morchelliformis]|nr:hypothetical protein JB92DRAFT_2905667 [Gautieria morchelliformis]